MDSEMERNSPTSPVCHSGFAEYDSIQQSAATEPTHHDGPTPDEPRQFGGESEDRTPRSELPLLTPTAASTNSQHPTYEPSEYFEPGPHGPFVVESTIDETIVPQVHQNAPTAGNFLALTEQERPQIHRDPSNTSTASTVTVRGYGDSQRRQNIYPNQAYTALQSQYTTPRYRPSKERMNGREPGHGQSSYSSSHIATLSNITGEEKGVHLGGLRTQGNSPANTPGPGLFDPNNKPKPAHLPVTEGGAYSSPFLNRHQLHTPRETHTADVSRDLISGRKMVNDYEILDELGRGVHGKVKLGRNLNTGQMVAIKIVERNAKRRRLGKNDRDEHEIRREVAILKKVRHGNVVSLLEVIDDPSRRKVYLVLEYVEFGEVKWRTPGANEIILVEHRRFERYSQGIVDSDAAELEDARIMRKADAQRRRLERRKQRELQRQRASQSESQMHTWSMEYGGNSDDEDILSRMSSSTTPSKQNSSRNLDDVDAVASVCRPSKSSSTSLASELRTGGGVEAELMGTMFGPYDTELLSARTPSEAETPEYASADFDEIDRLPEHFHYVPLMTLAEARRSIRDTVLGLEYLHYQGVVHRDIKPANLLVNRENRVKISDFGVSYIGRAPRDELEDGEQSASEAPDNEDDGVVDNPLDLAKTVGTPAFFAPELCDLDPDSEPAQITQAIDVWAVGVTLYCLVYGRVPFWTDSNSKWAIMNVIATEEVFIPDQRLKAVEEGVERRPGSSHPTMNSNKRRPHDLEYEPIGEDLRDLLRRLLIKDPRKRITLNEVKRHPWVLQGIDDAAQWLRDTAPERQAQGRKIEPDLTAMDIDEAVLPIGIFEKMKSAVRKFGGAMATNMGFARSDSRRRAKSTAASDSGRGPPSTVSSNSHVSLDSHRRREQRRPSLRVDEDFSEALKNSRDLNDQSFPRHAAASSSVSVESPYFLAALSNPPSPHIEASASAGLPTRRRSTKLSNVQSVMSTATSVRTIRQSDISQGHSSNSPSISPGLAEASRTVESVSGSGSGLGGLFGGATGRLIRSMRSRDGIAESPPINRERSLDRLYVADDDAHGGPSVALSNTVAAGHVDLPPSLRNHSPILAPGPMGKRNSIAQLELANYVESAQRASRPSSVSSRSSRFRQPVDLLEDRPVTYNSGFGQAHSYDTDPAEFERAHADLIRRRVLEDQRKKEQQSASASSSRPTTGVSQRTCPPSPDDLDLSLRTTPDSLNSPQLVTSSSEDPFPSGISQSTSSPSVPSIISAISSVATDGPMLSFHSDRSGDAPSEGTLPGAFESSALAPDDEFLHPVQTGQSSGRNSADDEDSDEDDGLVMGRTRSKTHSHVPGSESSRHKYRVSTHSTHRRRESGGGLSKVRSRSVTDDGHHI